MNLRHERPRTGRSRRRAMEVSIEQAFVSKRVDHGRRHCRRREPVQHQAAQRLDCEAMRQHDRKITNLS
jgi:hypothetical protein